MIRRDEMAEKVKLKKKKFSIKEDIEEFKKHYALFLMILPAFIFVVVFCYCPMYGIVMAFQEFDPFLGIFDSPIVFFDNFTYFFSRKAFGEILWNTFSISLYSLAVGFPIPIIFALSLNSVGSQKFKKTLQMVSYAPYFISVVVMVAMLNSFMDIRSGIFNKILGLFGQPPHDFLSDAGAFKTIYVMSGLWQTLGWNSIIYIATLTSVDVSLYEAADLDGANKLQKIIYIDLPSIAPTTMVLLILSVGNILSVGFEKTYLMQNDLNLSASEVISTYVYKMGILSQDYGLGTAVGLFNSVINFAFLVTVNFIAKKTNGYSLW
ncbi:MAG: sugar ABC transporter permease [Clostridiales bacterium]|nr:sugar ABC transporter permease [Clostridiales bacterium]